VVFAFPSTGKKVILRTDDFTVNKALYSSKGRTSGDLYNDTAGEIEARDVSNRAELTAEQRKNTRLDIDRTDVVFAESSMVSYLNKNEYDSEIANIKEQINNSKDRLNEMGVAFSGNTPQKFDSKTEAKRWAKDELKNTEVE
jgi:hypothetical protein